MQIKFPDNPQKISILDDGQKKSQTMAGRASSATFVCAIILFLGPTSEDATSAPGDDAQDGE